MIYDYLVVGAGLSGSVFSERAASLGFKILVIDSRPEVAGNAYDYKLNGNFVHKYGPHYFRTNSEYVVNYLSFFTEWVDANYNILSYTNNQYWQFPINLNTFEQLIGKPATSEEMQKWLSENTEKFSNPQNSEEVILSSAGQKFYEMFFKNYTIKQWKLDPKELSPSVCGRIPIRTDRNNSYFNDKFQKMPKQGYTAMVKAILDHKNITLSLETSFKQALKKNKFRRLVFTGPVDEYFNYCFGKLPYRSLTFEIEEYHKYFYQPAVQINYPNEFDYTRTVEIKHLLGGGESTVISKEYPADYKDTGEPFYPIPNEDSKKLYSRYLDLAKKEYNTTFLGRLGTYSYLNMDQVVAAAIKKGGECSM